jgi:endonuclease/exonuclease/phosphatase family metal-dependent hydrolase
MKTLRIMTYNVHSCRGSDGRLRPERILAVMLRAEPDVVALQELDGPEPAEYFAEKLCMSVFFVEARQKGQGTYGNALLSRLPGVSRRYGALPRLSEATEARAAQCVRFETGFGAVDVINTHLGLSEGERVLQAETLLGPDWLTTPELAAHHLLCGDLNARPNSLAYTRLCSALNDVQTVLPRPMPTFPAPFPLVRIDHVLASAALRVDRVEVPKGPARLASDHLPLVVDLLPKDAAWPVS